MPHDSVCGNYRGILTRMINARQAELLHAMTTEYSIPGFIKSRHDPEVIGEQRVLTTVGNYLGVGIEKIIRPEAASDKNPSLFWDNLPLDGWGTDHVVEVKHTSKTLKEASDKGINGLFVKANNLKWLAHAHILYGFIQCLVAYCDKDGHIAFTDYRKILNGVRRIMNSEAGSNVGFYLPLSEWEIIA